MPAGRPPKYKNAKQLQAAIDKYFEECEKKGLPYTVTGLAIACDLTRQSLVNYNEKDEFFDTIKKAKAKVEEFLENGAINGSLNTTFTIFNLKNNYGWKDTQNIEADVNNAIEIKVTLNED